MERRLHVVQIITRLNVGGPAALVLAVADRLDAADYEVTIIAGHPGAKEGDLRDYRAPGRAPVITVPTLVRRISPLRDLRSLLSLALLLRRLRPDVVHTHLAKAGLLGRLAAWLAGVPVVVHTFHGNVFSGYFGARTSGLFVLFERLLASLTTRIIVLSQSQRIELERRRIGAPSHLVEIPVGIDTAALVAPAGTLRRQLGIRPATRLVGIVARLVPIKGVDVFLEAASIIGAKHHNVHFVIAGDGELAGELHSQGERLGLRQRVSFIGFRADIAAVYADLDVVVCSSRNEGTPLSVVEALAAGRAIVATAVGGTPDVLEGVGVLVRPDDPTALAEAVMSLLADPAERARMSQAGRRRAQERYDLSLHTARLQALYASLTTSS